MLPVGTLELLLKSTSVRSILIPQLYRLWARYTIEKCVHLLHKTKRSDEKSDVTFIRHNYQFNGKLYGI